MTKAKSKSGKSTVKATAAKGSVRKSSIAPATSTPALIVLGFDDQQKPRGASKGPISKETFRRGRVSLSR
jgi:hypothetical protein